MPRRKTPVKNKELFRSQGLVDIHFHGAFGIDLMTASGPELDRLSTLLWRNGVAAFCPTTVSTTAPELRESVERLGHWIRSGRAPGARPLGIHLEGPFIHPGSCGAHPEKAIRRFSWRELESLWSASQETLKIVTLAPELLPPAEVSRLAAWAARRGVVLSLGHSTATEAQARTAFDRGFRGVTHAWNALPFHHRAPGPLGAAVGRKDVYLELILDSIHVDPTILRWTRKLHDSGKICFVSDCVPAAAARGWKRFGPLRIRLEKGACRLPGGALAGGGRLLGDSYTRWLRAEAEAQGRPLQELWRETAPSLTTAPLAALGLPPAALADRWIQWRFSAGKVDIEVDSA